MAIWNNNSDSNFKSYADSASFDASNFTACVWVNAVTQPANPTFLSRNAGNAAGDWLLGADTGTGTKFRFMARLSDNVSRSASDTVTFSTATWYHVLARWDGTSMVLYKNGVSTATVTPGGGVTQPAQDRAIRVLNREASTNPCNAYVADVGFWNVALTDAEITALALGLEPRLIRPTGLVLCDSLIDLNTRDIVQGLGTYTGTCIAEPHAPVMRKPIRRFGFPSAGGGSPPPSTNSNFFFAAA